MSDNVWIAGVGMIPFRKPGQSPSYLEMGAAAVRLALQDAGIALDKVDQSYAGYVYGDSTCGQRALYEVGMTGRPVFNVNNNCSSGSTALYLARQAIQGGMADCVLAFGFEQMQPGALTTHFNDRPSTFGRFEDLANELEAVDLPVALKYFGGAGREHMRRYGTPLSTFAEVRAKASRHAANNPLAVFRDVVTAADVLAAKEVWPGVMTRLMACPPTSGAAAAVLVSDSFARRLASRPAVRILAQALTTDFPSTFESRSMIDLVGAQLTRSAAQAVYERAGVGPRDIDVCELHDCFAQNEVISYEALGFCAEGEAARFVADGGNTYGGQVVVNPSGGLLSKGHPLGATGLAQCYELTRQLRGTAGPTQVPQARLGLQHNLGLGGAAVVTLFGQA